ncbi:MAG TPA: ATP-binding protein, partial [Pseudonocardiaceae bacterium]
MIEQGPVTARLPFLASLGEAGRLLASTDWAATPLGPVPDWPDELVHAIATCLPSRVPMLLWWSADLVQLYNDAYAGMIGGKHPAAFGQRAAECWAEVWQDLGPLAERVLDGGGATYAEDLCLLLNRFGYEEETYWTFSYSPVHGEDGTALGVFVATTDTTSRVINERRLRVLRALGEISTTEADAGTLMTRAMAVFAGDPQDLPFAVVHEVTGDAAVVLATRGSPAALDLDAVRRVGHGGEAELVGGAAFVQQLEAPAPGRPAVVLTVGLNPHRAFDTGYRTFLELGAARLSTALADADAYRKERRRAEALTELDRAKSEFFANVSHELRTPLTLIAGPAEEALTDAAEPLPAVHRERLGMVLRNADRLRLLVDDLLDFARIEAGRLEPRLRQVDLAALTREIAGSYAPAVERAGLTLRVDCGDAPLPVPVDAGMWEKVVLNLLTNAVKYTFEGSVHVRLTATDGHVELAVADTGIGVPEEELPTLFRRFHRVRGNTGRSHEGAGIGLALVRELAELHGGSVGVSSREGAGSTFRVRLPRTAAVPDEEEPPDAV